MKKLFYLFFIPLIIFANETVEHCIFLSSAKSSKIRKCSISTDISFLYWQAKTRGLEYAIVNQNPSTGLAGEIVSPNFKYEPAFRLAIRKYLPYDCFDITANYTRLEEKSNHNSISNNLNNPITTAGTGLIPVWVHPQAYANQLNDVRFSNAKAKWKINYNVINLELGKAFCITRIIALNPYIGLQGAIINQNFSVNYSNGNIFNINNNSFTAIATDAALKNFSYGIGPLFGLKNNWNLGYCFSIFTNLSLAILQTYFDLQRVENSLSSEIINGELRNDRAELNEGFYSFKPHALIAVGVRWDKYFGCKKRFAISAGYEGNYWFKQNQMIRFIDAIIPAKTRNTIGDLYLQGLTLNFSLDF
jgi:Legionella pneumophila major outer membrane protein precursor